MTLFEYLAVAVSIVLSFGAVRLLDGLPYALSREHRYWPHTIWMINLLWLHIQFWWVFWSYSRVTSWSYAQFLLAVAGPGLLYSLANTGLSSSPSAVTSWEAHFYGIRQRFFLLFACLYFVLGLSGWLILEVPFFDPLRIVQASVIVVSLVGARWATPAVHWVLAPLFTVYLFAVTAAIALGNPTIFGGIRTPS